jgi:outer membrane protein OmpA-like peptidoglycan-associated protein
MMFHRAIATALAASLATACASSRTASAPERAEQAEREKVHAEEDARRARIEAAEARQDAVNADRARYEADMRARYAAAEAAQAERDAQQAQASGVAESQPAYSRVTFAASSSDLPDSERAPLDEIVRSLQNHPSRKVVIHTYADDTGDQSKDERLAQRRADAVVHYFESRGIAPDRITVQIVSREVAYADVPEGERRAPFRRVVIVVR